jgi:hypothetical protein
MALNDGRLTNGWNSNLEKQVSAHEFSLETDRHPPGIHLFGDKRFINRFFIKQTNAPGRKYFTPIEAQLQSKMKARLSSYQWT